MALAAALLVIFLLTVVLAIRCRRRAAAAAAAAADATRKRLELRQRRKRHRKKSAPRPAASPVDAELGGNATAQFPFGQQAVGKPRQRKGRRKQQSFAGCWGLSAAQLGERGVRCRVLALTSALDASDAFGGACLQIVLLDVNNVRGKFGFGRADTVAFCGAVRLRLRRPPIVLAHLAQARAC